MDFLHCTYFYFHLSLSFNINNMPKETPRKRKSLTAAQKKEICSKKISTPSLKQKDIAKEYNEKNYHSNNEDIKFIKKLKKEALKERFNSTRQINLDTFVNVIE